jgi:hypothetical protein
MLDALISEGINGLLPKVWTISPQEGKQAGYASSAVMRVMGMYGPGGVKVPGNIESLGDRDALDVMFLW